MFPTSSLVMMTGHPPEEADSTASGLEMGSGITMQPQDQDSQGGLEHKQDQLKDSNEQISTNDSHSSIPQVSKSDIELVLDNAELLSLYYDPITDEYQHESQEQLHKDHDFNMVHSLLNNPGYM